jgi:hypothetical protein
MTATQEFVVPRSMPTMLPVLAEVLPGEVGLRLGEEGASGLSVFSLSFQECSEHLLF